VWGRGGVQPLAIRVGKHHSGSIGTVPPTGKHHPGSIGNVAKISLGL